jgi:hypothetical protein
MKNIALAFLSVFCVMATYLAWPVIADQPPLNFRANAQYVRTGVPYSPISVGTSANNAMDLVVRASSSTVCFAHGTQLIAGPCSTETHFAFSEAQAHSDVSTGSSWGEDFDDAEGDSTLFNRLGPATGLVSHGFTVPDSGWKTVVVPWALSEADVGFRGGVCSNGWPCDDDADCPTGTCADQDRDDRKKCMFLHAKAASAGTCQIEVYR